MFTGGGTALTPLLTDIGGLVTGDHNAQILTLALGVVNDPLWLRLDFRASSSFNGTNTAEYLAASVSQVPPPAALPLFTTGLGALGLLGWRRKRKAHRSLIKHLIGSDRYGGNPSRRTSVKPKLV